MGKLEKVLISIVNTYIGDELWLYRNFGILTVYNYKVNHQLGKSYQKLTASEKSMLHCIDHNRDIDYNIFTFKSLLNIINFYEDDEEDNEEEDDEEDNEEEDDDEEDNDEEDDDEEDDDEEDDDDNEEEDDEINYKKSENIHTKINEIIEDEYETGDIHPENYILKYLFSDILYYNNWEYLTDDDINKFSISYGIDLIFNRNTKIKEIIKAQNLVFESLVSKGYDCEVMGCPIIKKLIQK
jgi:hypothetical protein